MNDVPDPANVLFDWWFQGMLPAEVVLEDNNLHIRGSFTVEAAKCPSCGKAMKVLSTSSTGALVWSCICQP